MEEDRDYKAEAYMKEWAEWMDAPLGIPKEDQAHLDSIKQETNE